MFALHIIPKCHFTVGTLMIVVVLRGMVYGICRVAAAKKFKGIF